MNNQLRREGIKLKLWSSVIIGGLPKCKRRAPKSQSLSQPFYPTLYPDFWDVFYQRLFQLVAQMKKSDSPALQLVTRTWCKEGSHCCAVPGSTRNCEGEITHQRALALIPSDCLTSLPQHFIKAFSKAVRGAGCQQGKGKGEGISKKQNWQQPPV